MVWTCGVQLDPRDCCECASELGPSSEINVVRGRIICGFCTLFAQSPPWPAKPLFFSRVVVPFVQRSVSVLRRRIGSPTVVSTPGSGTPKPRRTTPKKFFEGTPDRNSKKTNAPKKKRFRISAEVDDGSLHSCVPNVASCKQKKTHEFHCTRVLQAKKKHQAAS